ncbi:MAG: hypothetical protein Q7R62_00610 [bacterium]|nr:hypothetical protein [bacterium]
MASRRLKIVKGPSKFALMVSEYDRPLGSRMVEFSLEDGTTCYVDIHAKERVTEKSSDAWNFIGTTAEEGVVRGTYSTANGSGWVQFVGMRPRSILELYAECDAALQPKTDAEEAADLRATHEAEMKETESKIATARKAARQAISGPARPKSGEFYTWEETLAEFQRAFPGFDEARLKRLVSEGEIRAYREGDRMKFKRSEIDNLTGKKPGS